MKTGGAIVYARRPQLSVDLQRLIVATGKMAFHLVQWEWEQAQPLGPRVDRSCVASPDLGLTAPTNAHFYSFEGVTRVIPHLIINDPS